MQHIPTVLLTVIQSYLNDPQDWMQLMNTSKSVFGHCKYEMIEVTIPATKIVQSRELPAIVQRLAHPEKQVHLILNLVDLSKLDYDWGFKKAECYSSSEKLKVFISWFLFSTPAKSLTWIFGTDIIDHVPGAYDILGGLERLSMCDKGEGRGTTVDLSRFPDNNRLRMLRLNGIEFVPFGCKTNLRELKELHVLKSWQLDRFLQPYPDRFPGRDEKEYIYRDKKPHPFAEYEFPGLEKVSFVSCTSYLPFNPIKFSHVSDITFDGCGSILPSLLTNLSFLRFCSPGISSEFDKVLAQSPRLKELKVNGIEIDKKKLAKVGVDCKIRRLELYDYQSEVMLVIPTLRSLKLAHGKLSSSHNLGHLFSVEFYLCRELKSVEGLGEVPVVRISQCSELTSIEGLRSAKYNRSITIEYAPKVQDFSPLNNVKKVSINLCDGFRTCSDVSGVRDLMIQDCKGLVTIGSELRQCQSLTLIRMNHLSSLVEIRDIPEITFSCFGANNKLLYDLGGEGNQKIVLKYGDIPHDLPYLDQYLSFERPDESPFRDDYFSFEIAKVMEKLRILLRKRS